MRHQNARRDDGGTTAVEFAIAAPVVFLLIWAAIYAGLYFYYSAAAAHIARVVARDAAMPQSGHYPSADDEIPVAHNAAGNMLPDPTTVTLVPNPSAAEGNELDVTVTYTLPGLAKLASLMPFAPHLDGHLSRTATVRYE